MLGASNILLEHNLAVLPAHYSGRPPTHAAHGIPPLRLLLLLLLLLPAVPDLEPHLEQLEILDRLLLGLLLFQHSLLLVLLHPPIQLGLHALDLLALRQQVLHHALAAEQVSLRAGHRLACPHQAQIAGVKRLERVAR